MFAKDTTRLRRFQKADSFPQRPRVCFSFGLSCGSCRSACCCCYWWNSRTLLHLVSSILSPNVQFCLSSCTSSMSVELVLVVRFPFWIWCLSFALPLAFLESRLASGHHLHSFHFQLTRSDSLQSFGKSNPIATKLLEERHCWRYVPNCKLAVPKKNRCHMHDHCVVDCICQRSSRNVFPLSDIQLPGSQA